MLPMSPVVDVLRWSTSLCYCSPQRILNWHFRRILRQLSHLLHGNTPYLSSYHDRSSTSLCATTSFTRYLPLHHTSAHPPWCKYDSCASLKFAKGILVRARSCSEARNGSLHGAPGSHSATLAKLLVATSARIGQNFETFGAPLLQPPIEMANVPISESPAWWASSFHATNLYLTCTVVDIN